MTQKIEMRTRKDIAKFLPKAIKIALASYRLFSVKTLKKDSAEFKKHHDACKVAISHIQLLIKLAQWADLPDPSIEDENGHKVLLELIENAKSEMDGQG